MSTSSIVEPKRILRRIGDVSATFGSSSSSFTLSNQGHDLALAEIIVDHGECEGGIPIFEDEKALGHDLIELVVVYSEGIEGIDHDTGL